MYYRKIIRTLFYADRWNIGFVNQPVTDFIINKKLKEITWMEEDHSDYSADPFVMIVDNSVYVYYEFLKLWHGRGTISQIRNFDFSTRKPVRGFIPANIHLSYPYILVDEEKMYCIPETAEANEVGLYKIRPGDLTLLEKERVLLSGAPYLDSSIIRFNGKYWLFSSRKDKVGRLFVFYAESLSEEFRPHLLNPIACDPRCIRGAGQLFVHNGIMYRPTQNAILEYGRSIIINRINELTERTLDSEIFFEVLPDKRYKDGTHTISFADDLIVVDGKRKVFSIVMIFKKLVREFKSFQARLLLLPNKFKFHTLSFL